MKLKYTLTLILPFVIAASAYGYSPIGGEVEKDPTKVQYTLLAQEALIKYANDNGASTSYNVLQVTRVTEQMTSGMIFRIDFFGVPTNCYMVATGGCSVISCHAKITDVPWLKERDVETKCTPSAL